MAHEVRDSRQPADEALADVVRRAMARWQVPGMTVAILQGGETESHGFGIISLETSYPTRPDTLFQIGSNSKVFTATLAMRLVEAGMLDLDAPIQEYLPELRLADTQAPATITLRHLFTHTSGLEGDRFEDMGEGSDALSRYIGHAHNWSQQTAPGEYWSYCNSGFGLAGRIVEVVTGTSFEAAMKERVFEPLGLQRSFYFAREAIVYSAAAGHLQRPDENAPRVALPYELGRRANPAGGIIASAADLLAFLRFHLGDGSVDGKRVLTAETLRTMQEPQVRITDDQAWGIGWGLRTIDGVRIIEHGGATNGHISQMLAVPSKGFGLVVLTNSNRGGQVIEQVEKWALARYCGLAVPTPQPVALPFTQLERLTGSFFQTLQTATVDLAEGALTLRVTGNDPFTGETVEYPPAPLAPLSEWEVMVTAGEWEGIRAQFISGADEQPRFMRLGGRLAPRQHPASRAH